jgi:hypothetical protein
MVVPLQKNECRTAWNPQPALRRDLRARAFACLGALFRKDRRATEGRRLRLTLTVLGAASVIYGVAMALGIVLVCHANIASMADAALPSAGVQATGWGGAGSVGLLRLTKPSANCCDPERNRGQHGAITGPVRNGESGHNSRS